MSIEPSAIERASLVVPADGTKKRLWQGFWLVFAPLGLACLALRFLIPGRGDLGTGIWGGLARLGDEFPLLLGIGFFFLFALLIRHFHDVLPGGQHIVARPVVAPTEAHDDSSAQRLIQTASLIILVGILALGVRTSLVQAYRVTSGSMLPSISPRDHVVVDKLAYGVRLPGARKPLGGGRIPARGDMITFAASAVGEHTSEEVLVKRVIGLPGDFIRVRGGVPEINGWKPPTCSVGRYAYLSGSTHMVGRLFIEYMDDRAHLTLYTWDQDQSLMDGYLVKPGEVFVLGDNRNLSRDSRYWRRGTSKTLGAGVPLSAIEGRAARIISWDREGHLAWGQFMRNPELSVYLPGMDAREIEKGIADCLKSWPTQSTRPPGPPVASPAP